ADPAQYAEAGAMRLPDFHPLVLALVDKLGLGRRPFHHVFVGEHTSLEHAWIEGALESAVRAAVAVHRAPPVTAPGPDRRGYAS
ncbi:FAD-dependent oxidoreductase, partial [Streptomyces sp. TRM76130]|nr:FAD-dependent oxidoreductase [Streptomyces sp. TRM76130]